MYRNLLSYIHLELTSPWWYPSGATRKGRITYSSIASWATGGTIVSCTPVDHSAIGEGNIVIKRVGPPVRHHFCDSI